MTKKIRVSLALALISCLAIGGCGAKLDEIPAVAKDIIRECGKEDGVALSRLVLDFLGQVANFVLAGEPIAWTDVEVKAEHEGTVVAQCAFVEIVSRFSGVGASTTITRPGIATTTNIASQDDAKAALEKLRAATGGGHWRLIGGDVH